MKPRVWHVKDPQLPEDAVRIDRGTKWGNPYRIGDYHPLIKGRLMTRGDVLALYEQMFRTPEWIQTIAHELKGKHLACWCKPIGYYTGPGRPCHGDFLLEIANNDAGLMSD